MQSENTVRLLNKADRTRDEELDGWDCGLSVCAVPRTSMSPYFRTGVFRNELRDLSDRRRQREEAKLIFRLSKLVYTYEIIYSGSKNCSNVCPFLKDWIGLQQLHNLGF